MPNHLMTYTMTSRCDSSADSQKDIKPAAPEWHAMKDALPCTTCEEHDTCQAAVHLEQTLPCMAQKSGFMSGSELATSGYSAFSALQAVSSVAQQFTIICGADSTNDCREFISCCLVQTEAPVLKRSPAQVLAGEREPSSGINMYLSQCQRSCRPQLPGRLHQVDSQLVLCLKRIPQHHHAVLSCLQLRPVAEACTL